MEEGLEAARAGNFKKALSELLPLARAGNAEAAYGVADMYRVGKGVRKDAAEAARWYRVAAQRSHAVAQYNLAVLYAAGEGVPKKDFAEARHWFQLAGDQGFAPAQYNLAVLHAVGEGGPRNLVQAYMWFELAAAQGNAEAASARDQIAGEMTKAQVAAAKELARSWRERHDAKTEKNEQKQPAEKGS